MYIVNLELPVTVLLANVVVVAVAGITRVVLVAAVGVGGVVHRCLTESKTMKNDGERHRNHYYF